MKSNIPVLVTEIGASSLLDFDWKEHKLVKDKRVIEWNKFYNNNKPKFYSKLYSLKDANSRSTAFRRELYNNDAIIYSMGNKGPRAKFGDYSPDDLYEIFQANLGKIMETLPTVIELQKRTGLKHLKVIFMGSVSGKEGNTYVNHSMYAACKAALSSIVRNLQEEYSGERLISFHLFELPYTASRMTGGLGASPDKVRDEIIKLILDK